MKTRLISPIFLSLFLLIACEESNNDSVMPLDPDTAGDVSVDRFSAAAAHLFMRTAENGFPVANAPIDFDNIPAFITKGLGPNGEMTQYYNFDVMSTVPAPIYVLFREGESSPVDGQLNIVNVKPGDTYYNDFWLVTKVTVPKGYVANTITSYAEIISMGYASTVTTTIVNCPIVPKGSIARKRYTDEDAGLTRGWYKSQVVYYFNFSEKALSAVNGMVPTSDIFVCFNTNPDQPMGGPPSGFKTEDNLSTGQTHNIPETVPSDAAYSPLWDVQIYDNTSFASVSDLSTAMSAPIMAIDAAIVNCPIVSVQ